MSLSFLTPSRTVLMISDEALFIYSISSKGVKLVEAVPWSADNFEENVAVILSKDCGGKPVVILNDMVEQHYRKEKVPHVGVLDKQSVVKRKLKVAFPNYPVRAALPLKEKVAKTSNSLAGSIYIFAAVPATEAFAKTMAATRRSLVSIVGFYLLPVEASDMIKKLANKLVSKNNSKAKWTVFIGQHQNGGLRQVVIRNGELALTRMTPIVESDEDPVLWSKDVYQEFQATMSYLSRFGFDPSDGLNVILISEPNTGDIVSELMDTPCNFYSLTSEDAADLLNISLGVQETGYHADALHVAWIGRKSSFILPMRAKQIENVSRPRQVAMFVSVLLALGLAFQGYQVLDYAQKLSVGKSEMEDITDRKSQLDLLYSKEVKRKEDLGYNIQLIQGSLAIYEELENSQIDVLMLFYKIGVALGRDMRIDRIEVLRGARKHGLFGGNKGNESGETPSFVASMQMTFPGTTDVRKGNREVKALQSRLQRMMPDHIVKVVKLLEDYEYSEAIVVETGSVQTEQPSQDYVVELSIEGPSK